MTEDVNVELTFLSDGLFLSVKLRLPSQSRHRCHYCNVRVCDEDHRVRTKAHSA